MPSFLHPAPARRPSIPAPVAAWIRAAFLACVGVALAWSAGTASAAGPTTAAAPTPAASASAPMSKGEAKAIREFKMLDFNGDGKLSRQEVALMPRLAGAFDAADTNRDGFVTLDEVRAFAVKYRAERDRAKAAAAAPSARP
ncbi:hypothetical protein Acidovoranil_24830 [Acidovorax sp. FG27]